MECKVPSPPLPSPKISYHIPRTLLFDLLAQAKVVPDSQHYPGQRKALVFPAIRRP